MPVSSGLSLITLWVSDTRRSEDRTYWGYEEGSPVWKTRWKISEGEKHSKELHCEETVPRLELDGQSSQHRHESKVRGHKACCLPWANPQSRKARDPLKGQTLPPACVTGRGGRRKQLCYWLHSPPPLTSHHTWQPSVLKDHFGNWEHSLEEQ